MRYLFFVLLFFTQSLPGQIISTIAGGGSSSSDNIPATNANIVNPSGFAFDKEGNLYFSSVSSHTIRVIKIDGYITTIAGTGVSGYSGDGGPATLAKLNQPVGIAIDSLGNIFFADGANNRIRKINKGTGVISTVVGSSPGFAGDGGYASLAMLKLPSGLCFDNIGNLLIADCGNGRIRKVDRSGIIHTVAGNGLSGWGGDGQPAAVVTCWPVDVCVSKTGEIYFSEWSWGTVRKIRLDGVVITVAGDTTSPHFYNGDSIPAKNARIDPVAIAVDKNGILFISDSYNKRIRIVKSDGLIYTVAGNGVGSSTGDGGVASLATVHTPSGMVFDSCGNLFFGQVNTPRIRKIAFNPDCMPMAVRDDVTDKTNGVTLLPNPAKGMVKLTTVAPVHTIAIYNLLGQMVLQQAGSGKPQQQIDVSTLPPGVYIVRVNDVWTARLVKE